MLLRSSFVAFVEFDMGDADAGRTSCAANRTGATV